MIRLIALDIDGTLLPENGSLTERTKETLQNASSAGIIIALATARPYRSALPLIQSLELGTAYVPVICFAGSAVQLYPDGTFLHCDTFSAMEVRDISMLCAPTEQYLQVFRSDGSYYFQSHCSISDGYASYFGYSGTATDLNSWTYLDAVRCMMVVPQKEKQPEMQRFLETTFRHKYPISCSWPAFYDIQPAGSNKGKALQRLAEHLQLQKSEIAAFGDQTVDYSMLEYAGVGVAMENGDPVLKASADLIAPPCNQDGAAKVIDALLTIQQNQGL